MQRVIYSALRSPLKRRNWIIASNNQYNALFFNHSQNNAKAISTTTIKLNIESNNSNSTSKNIDIDSEEKILVSNIEGLTKDEIKKSKEESSSTSTSIKQPKKKIQKRIPSRHSRKLAPSIASSEIVDGMSQEILSSPIGSLYTYDKDFKSKDDDGGDDQGFIVSDVWVQKVEFLLRGHSSLLEGSIVREELVREGLELPDIMDNDVSTTRVEVMQSLLERMEKEGEAYKQAYIDAHSALVKSSSSSSSSEQHVNVTSESKEETAVFSGAPPGPTITMYDLVLDAHAISLLPKAISNAKLLFNKAVHRHFLNGGPENTNRDTIPTALTFNAVIRAASNTHYNHKKSVSNNDDDDDEQLRDEALDVAFYTFDKMYHTDATNRNTATYLYMLRMLKKCMPESRVRGNIAHALFDMAVEEHVMDETLYEELKVSGGGELYENWLKYMSEKEVAIDAIWKKNCVRRRYHQDSNTY